MKSKNKSKEQEQERDACSFSYSCSYLSLHFLKRISLAGAMLAAVGFAEPVQAQAPASDATVVPAARDATTFATSPENVLSLDGTNACVELPSNAFNNLDEVTVEGWVKWESFGNASRFFDFQFQGYLLDAQNRFHTPNLWAERIETDVQYVQAPGILSPGNWVHVAVAAGKQGLRLFVNGSLVSSNTAPYDANISGVEH